MKKNKKTVLITGSASGFGAYLAKAFHANGYEIVLHDIRGNEKNLLALQEKIEAHSIVFADLRNPDELQELERAIEALGVNILVNNAGVNPELRNGTTVENINSVQEILRINTSATIALCYATFEHMKKSGGIILNINSIAGLKGSVHEPVYAASKFGLRGFSESVKDAWLKQGVRMIDMFSGGIATGMSVHSPIINNLIKPEEYADFIVNLCATNTFFPREVNVQRTRWD